MIGIQKFSIKISFFSLVIQFSGCAILPGMQNPHSLIKPNPFIKTHAKIYPKFIAITPKIILNQKISHYEYHVAPNDVLQINVWQHPEFNFTGNTYQHNRETTNVDVGGSGIVGYLVNSDGMIYFPLIKKIKVANQTVEQIRQRLTDKLKIYIPDPQLNVRVAEFRSRKAYVLGEVKKTGFLPINDQRLSIAQALALSEWFDQNAADTSHIFVIRGSVSHPCVFWLDARTPDKLLLAEKFELRPNDILYVSSAPVTNWNRAINQVLPTIQALWFTKALVQQPY